MNDKELADDILALNRRKLMSKAIVAFDPGKKGAIAGMVDGEIYLHKVPLIGKEVDIHCMADIIDQIIGTNEAIVIVEDVHSIYNASAVSNFQFGRVLGFIEGILSAKSIPFMKVGSKAWQAVAFQGIPVMRLPGKPEKGARTNDTKSMALMAAKRLYPKVNFILGRDRTEHDGAVDALLMCHYAKIKNL